MTTDQLSWGTVLAAAIAVVSPIAGFVAWMVSTLQSGSQSTIRGQSGMLDRLERQNAEQAEKIDNLSEKSDTLQTEVRQLHDLISFLLQQLVDAGITPNMPPAVGIHGIIMPPPRGK